MDDTPEIVKNFETILKEEIPKKPISLYSGIKVKVPDRAYSPREVLSTVSRQLKAIQNADCASKKSVSKNLNNFKSSSFLPVNMLPKSIEVPPKLQNAATFETQCVSDTQLIHIVQDVEALHTHRGITQEFDMPFCHMNSENEGSTQEEPVFPIIDISLKEPDPNKGFQILSPAKDDNHSHTTVNTDTQAKDCTQLINDCIEIENIDQLDNFTEDTNVPIPSSPILNIRSTIKKPTTKSLVVDLDVFEKFEKIAVPLIEESKDLTKAKELINSQIIGNEVCLQSNVEPILKEIHTFDFIQELTNEKSMSKLETSEKDDNTVQVDTKSENNSQINEKILLKDEILFSSDEEEEYIHKSIQDLPFTCALETSFYEQSDVLDKTMFVGFQTASNKSIQICSESFSKAKNMLEDVSKDMSGKEPTLTEMVKICDSFNTKQGISNIIDENFVSKTEEIKDRLTENIVCEFTDFEINGRADNQVLFHDEDVFLSTNVVTNESKNEPYSQKRKFEGFKTASNKRIKLSDIALERSKKIFQDIYPNLETNDTKLNYGVNKIKNDIPDTVPKNNIPIVLSPEKSEDQTSEILKNIKIDDVNILKEFENVEMDTQFFSQTKNTENVQLIGFKTASNKNIEISKEAVEKTSKIFQDIDLSNKINVEEIKNINKSQEVAILESNIGFKTASNKQIKVSEQALAKTKNIFRDIDKIDITDPSIEDPTLNKLEEENITKLSTEVLPGFKTASNKDITISKEAIAKTKNFFKELESGDSIETNKEINHKEVRHEGFKTASNKKVSISAKAMARTKRIFENLDDVMMKNLPIEKGRAESPFYGLDEPKNKEGDVIEEQLARDKRMFEGMEFNDDCNNVIESNKNVILQGFQTASKKPINISAEALARSKKVFGDIDLIEEKCDKNNEENVKKVNPVSNLEGIQTANNKLVKVSDNDLTIKTRNMFQEIDNEILSLSQQENNLFQFKGFQTASKKPVKISEEALAKSRKIFQDIDKGVVMNTEIVDTGTKFQGFQTASNKAVRISEEALAKSRKIFQDIDKGVDVTEIVDTDTKFQDFHAASNKAVRISEEALAKSRKIFQDIEPPRNIKDESSGRESTIFVGFQTASKKPVKISESALAKSRKIFQDIDKESINTETNNQASIPKLESFPTESKKHVNISKETIVKSKLFKDIVESDEELLKKADNSTLSYKCVGFQTASNKKVKISEEALAKSRKIFQDINADDKDEFTNKSAFKCFQTANNKSVAVSEQALIKSSQIFQDMELSDNNSEKINHHESVRWSNRDGIANNEEDKSIIESKAATNNNDNQSSKSKHFLGDVDKNQKEKFTANEKDTGKHVRTYDFNLQNIIDTQVMNNFDETLYTEDFFKEATPKSNKRSGSPILSCPKAKRRKRFEIPYSQKPVEDKPEKNVEKIVQKLNIPVKFVDNYKKTKKYSLKDLEKMENESDIDFRDIDPYILEFHFDNLLKMEFFDHRNDVTEKKLTVDDIKTIFLETVNRKLVPDGWIDNHLKLILWKLISYEIKYPITMKYTCSAKNVIDQLKYRYDRELYDAQRPALRKILEKDDTSMRTTILCVVRIFQDGVTVSSATNANNIELLLTDGWYCIRACIDRMLATLVCAGKIAVGTKLATHGAELVNCEQGVSPWEDTSSIRLKLSGNSTRRARWDARLGYHGNGAMLSQLSYVRSDGGRVARLRAFVTRVYPALYIEKFASGNTVTRSERLEHLHQVRYEAERQALLEKLYEDVEKEFSLQSQDSQRQQDTPRQREKLLQEIQARVQEKMESQGLEVTRNVVPLLKMRVVGVAGEKRGEVEVTKAMIAIWKPNEAVLEMVREGAWIEVMNVVPTAVRYSELQLSAGRQSVFSQSKYKGSERIEHFLKALKRTCYTIKDLAKNPSKSTEYNEVDTVGIIFLIEPSLKEFDCNKHQFQNVYLTDADKNMICINFWGGLKKFGFENVLDTGQVVYCTNLQKRAGNTRKNILQYRVTEFSYFTKTPKNMEARDSMAELTRLFSSIDKTKFCDDCVSLKNNYSVVKMQSNHENVSPYRFPNIDINLSKNRMFIDSPLAQKPQKVDDLNLTGLDFESTFKQTDTQDLSPKTLLRKMQVKEKLAKLKMYGEPPPLSPIYITNRSKNAGSAFKSPLIQTDVSRSVASEQRNLLNQEKDEDIQCSPVISMNRTYVKKSANPVKLNFSSAMDESDVDHFAEEFDGSPPLSLD